MKGKCPSCDKVAEYDSTPTECAFCKRFVKLIVLKEEKERRLK